MLSNKLCYYALAYSINFVIMQTPILSRSQSNATVFPVPGDGCGADVGTRVGSMGGGSDVLV